MLYLLTQQQLKQADAGTVNWYLWHLFVHKNVLFIRLKMMVFKITQVYQCVEQSTTNCRRNYSCKTVTTINKFQFGFTNTESKAETGENVTTAGCTLMRALQRTWRPSDVAESFWDFITRPCNAPATNGFGDSQISSQMRIFFSTGEHLPICHIFIARAHKVLFPIFRSKVWHRHD